MPDSYGYTRIRQLPEAVQLLPTDWLIVENDLDTWKVKVEVFNQYIDGYIDEYIKSFTDEINDQINAKFNDLQIIVNHLNELERNIQNDIDAFERQESSRQNAEQNRQDNEEVRQKIFDDMTNIYDGWTVDIAEWSSAEVQRQENEQSRQQSENERISAEQTRNQAECIRGVAEGERQSAEEERIRSEKARKEFFQNAVEWLDNSTNYINAFKESVSRYGKAGVSSVTTDTELVVPILEVSIPIDNLNDYESLLYIREGKSDHEVFFGFSANFTRDIDGSITSGTAYFNIPNRYKNVLNRDMLLATYRVDREVVMITLEYKASVANVQIRTENIWDNISLFRSDVSPIYSVVLRDQIPKTSFNTTIVMTTSLDNTYGSPQGFVTILDKLKEETDESIEAIAPYKMYPIGTIYMTTSSKDPSELLKGGTWRKLYGDGYSEGISIDGVEQYSPVIYYWERTK